MKANTSDPSTWTTFDAASAGIDRFDGLGIVLGDGLTGADLDNCRNPETGELAEWATGALHCLSSYTEVSPSGTGLHILCFGSVPAGFRNRRALPDGGRIELYDSGRYFTFTGDHLPGTPNEIQERTAELATFCEMFDLLPEAIEQEQKSAPPAAPPVHTPYLTDEVLIERMLASNQKARTLWHGDTTGKPSPSEADQALCEHLAFWTGRDPDAIDRLFRLSGLYRQKWERADYRARTIAKAIAFVSATYRGGLPAMPGVVRADDRLKHRLSAGALRTALLRAAGSEEPAAEAAAICGVSLDTAQGWWQEVVDAGLEHVASTRPDRRFTHIAETTIRNSQLTNPQVRTKLNVLKQAADRGGITQVSMEKIAEWTGYKTTRTPQRHVQALEAAGEVVVTRFAFNETEGHRSHCNVYCFPEVVTAWERTAEAQGSLSTGIMSPPSSIAAAEPGSYAPAAVEGALAAEGTSEAFHGALAGRNVAPGSGKNVLYPEVYTAGEGSTGRSVVGCTQPNTELHGSSAVYGASEEEKAHHSISPPSAAKQPLQPTAAEGGQEGADNSTSRTHDCATLGQVQAELLRRGIPRRRMPNDVDISATLAVTQGDLQAAVSLLLDDLRLKRLVPTLLQEGTQARAPEDEPPAVIEPPPLVFTKQAVPPTGPVVPGARVVEIARREGLDPEEAHWLIEAGRLEVTETQVAEEVAV